MATKKSVAKKADTKPTALKDLTVKELLVSIDALRKEAVDLKRGTKTGEVQNVRAYSTKRKDVARALTALNAKKATGEDK
jgi:ribosomal protein L29